MKLAQGMKLVVEKQWRRAIIAFKESVAASPHLARDGTA
jgi:hypothetical protein